MGKTAEGQDNGNPTNKYPAVTITSVATPDPNATFTHTLNFAAQGSTTPIIAPGKTTPGYKTVDDKTRIAGS